MLHVMVLHGLLPEVTFFLVAVCLLVSAVGFFRLVLFISVGYGYSVAAMAIAVVAVLGSGAGWITWAQTFVMFAYGVRLGTYLLVRERSAGYRSSQAEDRDRGGRSGLALKLVIWVSVSVLYVCMFLPLLSRYASADAGRRDPLAWLSVVGVVATAVGLIIEAVADAQKRATKRQTPNHFCDRGLYRVVRYPNYFGELLVWTGNLIAGASLIYGWLEWSLAVAGYLCIVLIMIGSTRRLEIRQDERYGKDPEYRSYATRVPVLLPLVPVYSVRNARIYLG